MNQSASRWFRVHIKRADGRISETNYHFKVNEKMWKELLEDRPIFVMAATRVPDKIPFSRNTSSVISLPRIVFEPVWRHGALRGVLLVEGSLDTIQEGYLR